MPRKKKRRKRKAEMALRPPPQSPCCLHHPIENEHPTSPVLVGLASIQDAADSDRHCSGKHSIPKLGARNQAPEGQRQQVGMLHPFASLHIHIWAGSYPAMGIN